MLKHLKTINFLNFSAFRLFFFLLVTIVGFSCGNSASSSKENTTKSDKAVAVTETKTILFFGNSLTAGYGLEDASEAFPALIQNKIDSLKLPYKAVNAGLSGETTSGGLSRIDWLLKQKVDVFVLELGANDGLRGLPTNETAKNLQGIIDKVKGKYPEVKLVMLGMEVPPNMGDTYTSKFRVIFREIAKKNNMAFVPFMLEGVAGNPKLNQGDGIHPTAEGYHIVAENVWKELVKVL